MYNIQFQSSNGEWETYSTTENDPICFLNPQHASNVLRDLLICGCHHLKIEFPIVCRIINGLSGKVYSTTTINDEDMR